MMNNAKTNLKIRFLIAGLPRFSRIESETFQNTYTFSYF